MQNNIRILRNALNITQADLAERINVSRQTIIAIESGRYIPSTLLALKIARVLKKKMEDIFTLEESD